MIEAAVIGGIALVGGLLTLWATKYKATPVMLTPVIARRPVVAPIVPVVAPTASTTSEAIYAVVGHRNWVTTPRGRVGWLVRHDYPQGYTVQFTDGSVTTMQPDEFSPVQSP